MLFVVDFDGTLSTSDSVDSMLETFAAPAWEDVEAEWLAGRITAVQCMQRQLRMVNAERSMLESFFRGIALDASFLSFYQHVRQFSRVAIVSDGLDHAIHAAMKSAAFPELPVYANKLHFLSDGIDISWPHKNAACSGGNGVCKCSVANDLASDGECIVLIGDGKSDACLAGRADVVFAKGGLIDFCEANGIAHHRFQTFADVLEVVSSWPVPADDQQVAKKLA